MAKEMVRFAGEMSSDIAQKFDDMVKSQHSSNSDIFRKALFLMYVAIESKKKGNSIAVVDKNGRKVSDIIL